MKLIDPLLAYVLLESMLCVCSNVFDCVYYRLNKNKLVLLLTR